MSTLRRISVLFCLIAVSFFAYADGNKPQIKSMVVFGDSLSDNGNLNHLLKSLRFDEDPAYLVTPLKQFVFNKMDDFAEAFYVPQSVLYEGKATVRHFLEDEVAPMIATLVGTIRTMPLIPESPYWEHHFTDGKVWNEVLAEQLGINTLDSEHFSNQAFGGSWAMTYDYQLTTWNLITHPLLSLQNLIQGKLVPPSLGLAIQAHLLATRKFDTEAAYFIFSGGNDYLNMLQFEDNYNRDKAELYVEHAIDGLLYSTESLIKAGARKIIIFGSADISKTPFYNKTADAPYLDEIIKLHNAELNARVNILKENYPHIKFTYIDIAQRMGEIIASPENYNLKITKEPCIDLPLPTAAFSANSKARQVFGHNIVLETLQYAHTMVNGKLHNNFNQCSDANDYFFFDVVHPTAKVHKFLAEGICEQLAADGYDVNCSKKA